MPKTKVLKSPNLKPPLRMTAVVQYTLKYPFSASRTNVFFVNTTTLSSYNSKGINKLKPTNVTNKRRLEISYPITQKL
jgi:hypothetical protein